MGLANNKVIKDIVDLLTDVLTVLNKITGESGKVTSMIAKWAIALATFKGGGKLLGSIIKMFGGSLDLSGVGVKGAASLMGGLIGSIEKNKGNLIKSLGETITGGIIGISDNFNFNKILKSKGISIDSDDLKELSNRKIFSIEALEKFNSVLDETHDKTKALEAAAEAEKALGKGGKEAAVGVTSLSTGLKGL